MRFCRPRSTRRLALYVSVKFMSIARLAGVGAVEFSSPGSTLKEVMKAMVHMYRLEGVVSLEKF